MKPEHSTIIEKALKKVVNQVVEIDRDESSDFLQECAAEMAAHHVMGNIECGRVKDLDYWETQTDNFEAGLKVGAEMQKDDRVFTAGLDPDDDPVFVNHLFYFVGKDPRDVAKRLKEAGVDWIDSLRKDKGLLPFPTE